VVTGRPLRVVFFGTPAFAVPTLEALLDSSHTVAGVVTQPDRPRGRGHRVSDAPVKSRSLETGMAVLQPVSLKTPEFLAELDRLDVDLGIVAAYGRILTEAVLAIPRLGMINVHASLLPKYRGAAPVHRAVIAGERETGVTIMRVVKALDAGPMMATATRAIGIDETSDVVEHDLALLGASLLVQVVGQLAAGSAREVPQNEADATYAPRLSKEEGHLDFNLPAISVHNRIRGLQPWPMAYTYLSGRRLILHEARLSERETGGANPGVCISAATEGLTVACGDGHAIVIARLQPEGRRVMSARDYLAGHGALAGQTFE
jgi:methionyl-tRNA formyltransferase